MSKPMTDTDRAAYDAWVESITGRAHALVMRAGDEDGQSLETILMMVIAGLLAEGMLYALPEPQKTKALAYVATLKEVSAEANETTH